MPWYGYVIIGNLIVSGLYKIWLVGRPRQPVTGGEAVVAVIELSLLIWGVVALSG
jgi:hypothetical protein